VFRFKPLIREQLLEIIAAIAKKEGLTLDSGATEALIEVSGGDCRRLENMLQSCAAIAAKINEDLVFSMGSVAKPKEVREILELAVAQKFIDARKRLLDTMLNYSLSGIDIIKQFQKEIMELPIDNRKKMLLVDKCGEAEFRMTEGSDEFLQLEVLLANVGLVKEQ